jgi:hypothetical protein
MAWTLPPGGAHCPPYVPRNDERPAIAAGGRKFEQCVGLSSYKLKTGLDHYFRTIAENGPRYTTSGLLPEAPALLDRLGAK